jgi:hypothetical protein
MASSNDFALVLQRWDEHSFLVELKPNSSQVGLPIVHGNSEHLSRNTQ